MITTGEGDAATTQILDFFYDSNGTPLALKVGGVTYYYVTNLQGDAIQLVDSTGTAVAAYEYDPFGNIVSQTGDLAELNPLRYRGYYYDKETGLYYVSSRYYDPEIGRFINADDVDYLGAGASLTSYNLFAYCGNNPVSNVDPSGNAFFTALGALTGFIAGALTATIHNALSDEKIDVFTAGTQGAIGGAISGAGVDAALLLIGSFGTALPVVALAGGIAYMAGGLGNAYTTYLASNGTASDEEMTMSFHIGGAFNLVSLGTSWGCAASNVDELMYLGNAGFKANLAVGTGIAVSTGIATGIGSKIFSACLN